MELNVLNIVMAFIKPCWIAFVASILWGWFMVPLGAPAISWGHALGLFALMALFLTKRPTEPIDRTFVWSLILPFVCLGFGYLGHLNI